MTSVGTTDVLSAVLVPVNVGGWQLTGVWTWFVQAKLALFCCRSAALSTTELQAALALTWNFSVAEICAPAFTVWAGQKTMPLVTAQPPVEPAGTKVRLAGTTWGMWMFCCVAALFVKVTV